jgi:opacity protein-like surface antigen
MNKIYIAAASIVGLLSAANCNAQSSNLTGFYGELGLVQAYYKEPTANFNNTMASATVGYSINKYVGVEVMGAGAIADANFSYRGTNISAKTSSAFGGYVKGSLPLNDMFEVFAKVGATNGTVTASSAYGSAWSSGTSFSYGAGAQANFTKNVYGIAQYMSYYDRNSISISGPAIGVGYKF